MPREIYIQVDGKMTLIADPLGSEDRANFVITYKGMDWSGFRTLRECVAQFGILESRLSNSFAVVEK